MPLELTLNSEQQVELTITPATIGGHQVAIDGDPVFSVASGDCTLAPGSTAMSTVVLSGTSLGDSTILVSADADLGEGVEGIQDTCLVHVVHANAATLGLSAGTPTLKP